MPLSNESQSILIVDDNPTNLEVLSESLSEEGFQVAVAIDGESALEQVRYHSPALILLDVMMPGIDGFETCRRLKENLETQEIPVIFMTALSDADSKVKGLSIGAVDYITKPFNRDEVMARVRVQLRVQSLAKALQTQNQQLKAEVAQRKQAEEKLLMANDSLDALNQTLETQVAARTEDLAAALKKVQQTQSELVHREKLSALGQMVAGIAHEINNPVNFVCGNLEHAERYTHELLDVVSLLRQAAHSISAENQEKLDDLDIDFIAEDLPNLLRSMQTGTERIRSIVLSLRIFSRIDEAEVKDTDLHKNIDSTLLILNSRIAGRPAISVVKEYGDLPLIKCYPGQLNQVCMNILSNAIDALNEQYLEAADSNWTPEIRIRTALVDNDKVSICIADNGTGIPEAISAKIFDPFFTTKPIGKGTGLGMSISHDIVTGKHQGTIVCQPVLPHGTEFVITIPTSQKVAD